MAGRFITVEYIKGELHNAKVFFSSIFFANVILSFFVVVFSIFFLFNIDYFLNIPNNLINDVKILFLILILNFIFNNLFSLFSVSTFIKNKIYLDSFRRIESNILKLLLLIFLFTYFKPSIIYVGITTLCAQAYLIIFNIYYTKKYLPEFNLSLIYFDRKSIFILIKSGIWNAIIKLGQIFLEGLDLLIINIFIGSFAMGQLALAKTIPTLVIMLIGVISSVFLPEFTIYFAKNQNENLIFSIKKSMKLLSIITCLPIGILTVFGKDFFLLWVPNQDAALLQNLSIIICFTVVISGSINSLYEVFTVTNKLKTNALIVVLSGILNLLIVYILLKNTTLGIYAIAGVSTLLSILRNLLFTVPYGAKYLGLRWTTFYPEVLRSIFAFLIVLIIGLITRNYILAGFTESWSYLFFSVIFTLIFGLLFNMFFILDSNERNLLLSKLKILK